MLTEWAALPRSTNFAAVAFSLARDAPKRRKPIKLLVGNCLAHGRRQFVQITPNFPEPCRHVLEVYDHEQPTR